MIGVFDSGLGGLSVLAAIARALPDADLTYLADSAHVPYGEKDNDFIRGRALAIGSHLVEQGCRMLVVACNTATAHAVIALRDAFPDIPVVGVEPGIKPAAQSTQTGHIAVLATEATARSERLQRLIQTHASQVTVHIQPCPGWATCVETLNLASDELTAAIHAKVQPLLDAHVDRIVLGCTHYTFLVPLLTPLVQGRAQLIDVADAVARRVVQLGGGTNGHARLRLMATAHPDRLHTALPALGLSWLAARTSDAELLDA
jgi:glutamate racemase